jgi:hypothetical protein
MVLYWFNGLSYFVAANHFLAGGIPLLPHLVHVLLSCGIPLLLGFWVGRLTRSRVGTRLGRVSSCLLAIAGCLILQYIGFFIMSVWMVGGESNWTGLTPVGLLSGLVLFVFIESWITVPFTVVGYLFGSRLRRSSVPGPPG